MTTRGQCLLPHSSFLPQRRTSFEVAGKNAQSQLISLLLAVSHGILSKSRRKKKSVFNSLCIILYKVHVYYSHSSSQLLPVGCSTLLISAASAQTNVTQTGSCYPSVCVKVPLRGRRREKAVVVNLQDHTPAREWG